MALSGQITVTTSGTAVQGTSQNGRLFALKAHPDNTDVVWVGNVSGDVASTNGFPLEAGETVVLSLDNLDDIYVDADVNGEKLCWIRLN
jgi:hypothetical protein